jgi:TRAP-type C4-dicarboxylate transport system permease small subunit
MQWADVVAPPSRKLLRQFAGLFLVCFLGLAAWRIWQGRADVWAAGLAAVALGVGLAGLVRPSAVRLVYTGWMIVAFPIGWTVSRVALALVFYVVITPVALVFRVMRRDELQLRRADRRASYWRPKPRPESVREYLRQS